MKLTRVQEAIKVLRASVDEAPIRKASDKKVVSGAKSKKVTKPKK